MPKQKAKSWFKPVRGSYLPASPVGLLIYTIYVVYLAALTFGWYVDGHRIWYLITQVIPLSVGAALIAQYIAAKHTN